MLQALIQRKFALKQTVWSENNITAACDHCNGCERAGWIEFPSTFLVNRITIEFSSSSCSFLSLQCSFQFTPPPEEQLLKLRDSWHENISTSPPIKIETWDCSMWKWPKSVSTLDTSSRSHLTDVPLATPPIPNPSPFPFICLHPSLALHQCWLILLFHYSLEVASADAALRSFLAPSAFLKFPSPYLHSPGKKGSLINQQRPETHSTSMNVSTEWTDG